ncbi:DUF1304 domain-containing protein [Staphylococcus pasteuri]|uniref:DUF1304 domain-containing protein n=1 Tax=Staphylococcus TaxID=1279 RepID=UPI000362862F|nr:MULTISPECIES: DUF1304 domain-containing protein [Staphylococcus]MBM6506334.1 DUF1304 domain-containing protein [Staphylococcus pasteuri]MCD9067800.1 DUF1304 domain-containing protein [Staphylococcus pasteuri]MCT1927448.1 DUF1304 domain-containing protein [Staphylococcus pasteuri]MEB6612415.1 DUF1304 domain-containing protein [Staphylococcus pasteuri]MEB7435185.1 DUF1304 domain-containing protein [Staphylococcus pasteuri]
MSLLSTILTLLVAIEFIFIMILQTFMTSSKKTSQTFKMSQSALEDNNLNTLMKNQGIYNGLLGLFVIYATFFSNHPRELIICILVYMIIVAIYGSLTSQKSIIIKQGLLPILALLSLIF